MDTNNSWSSALSPILSRFQRVIPAIRTTKDMNEVFRTPGCCPDPDLPLYYMYRDVASNGADRSWLKKIRVRYDITVIPPATLCGEWVKTYGHFHPDNSSGTGFPEIYEVLMGSARYLLQSVDGRRFVCVRAGQGNRVLIPPGYGHVTVNPSPKRPLIMANLVSDLFSSDYGAFRERQGAAYYLLSNGTVEKNMRYAETPSFEEVASHVVTPAPLAGKGLYEMVEDRDDLGFLNRPEQYRDLFPV
jgi:glucose-6-phosphate isomerase, archaeal